MGRITTKIALFRWGNGDPSNTWFLGPTQVSPQTACRCASAVLDELTHVTNTDTDTPTTLLRL